MLDRYVGILLTVTFLSFCIPSTADILPYRGINLGGWLVLESWITTTLYQQNNVPEGNGEYQFCTIVGSPEQCCNVLIPHWDTWVNQSDIQTLASSGITHVRIPIGYWLLGNLLTDEPYCTGPQIYYLQRLISWLKQEGLKAVIDLHGAPGSQNGNDNSGKSGGNIQWNTPTNEVRTTQYLVQLAQLLNQWEQNSTLSNVVIGIELLNEPKTTALGGPIQMTDLANWYRTTITALQANDQGNWSRSIWLADGWNIQYSEWITINQQFTNIIYDSHLYYAFGGPTSNLSPWGVINYVCSITGPQLQNITLTTGLTIVIGEYSLAIDNRITPNYPYNTNDINFYYSFGIAQMQAYGSLTTQIISSSPPTIPRNNQTKNSSSSSGSGGSVVGSFYWCHRVESYQEWNYLRGIEQNYISNNLTLTNLSPSSYLCNAPYTVDAI